MATDVEIAADDPMKKAWEKYKATPEFENSKLWAMRIAPIVHSHDPAGAESSLYELMPRDQRERHVDGSLWAAFVEGYRAASQNT